MKVYKLEVIICDSDVESIEQAENLIDETRFPNHTHVFQISCREADIGEWNDNSPLNSSNEKVRNEELKRLFP